MKFYQKAGLVLVGLSCLPVIVGITRSDPESIWTGVMVSGLGLGVILLGKFGILR